MALKQREQLVEILSRIDGRGYKSYKEIEGEYDFGQYALFIDHVQPDPFAPPSRVRVRVPQSVAGFPTELFHNKHRSVALADFLIRHFSHSIGQISRGKVGSGSSGLIRIDKCYQEVLERSAMKVNENFVEARFCVGLPASGRMVLGMQASRIFCQELPQIVEKSLLLKSLNEEQVHRYVKLYEDQNILRGMLSRLGLVAFIADGSLLPRASGIDDRPLTEGVVVAFESPKRLRKEVILPHTGVVSGLGIPQGITLIIGGGFHGKSTLLRAIEKGIYNHIRGDGREFVISIPDAFKIKSESGRRVEKVNISPFINDIPYQKDTVAFSTDNSSGSTSQAANIIEALEMGASLLLIDEDTSSTNFMIRDHRMQVLVPKEKEPITPFIDKARQLYQERGVSSIIALGGSGDYFDIANVVIMMDSYKPIDLTFEAQKVAQKLKSSRKIESGKRFGDVTPRLVLPESIDTSASDGRREVKIAAKGLHAIVLGAETIDLSNLDQLVDPSQTRAIAAAIYHAKRRHYIDGQRTLAQLIELIFHDIETSGLEVLDPRLISDLAIVRKHEVAAALNRLRSLKIRG